MPVLWLTASGATRHGRILLLSRKQPMAATAKRYIIMESPHGKPVVVVPMMVTHVASRGASECEV